MHKHGWHIALSVLLMLPISMSTHSQNNTARPKLVALCDFQDIYHQGDRVVFQSEKLGSFSVVINKLNSNRSAEFILFYDTDKTDTFSLSLDHNKPMPIALHKHGGLFFIWQQGNNNTQIQLCEHPDTLTQAKLALSELNAVPVKDAELFEAPKTSKGCSLSPSITVPINTAKRKLENIGYDAKWNNKLKHYSLVKI